MRRGQRRRRRRRERVGRQIGIGSLNVLIQLQTPGFKHRRQQVHTGELFGGGQTHPSQSILMNEPQLSGNQSCAHIGGEEIDAELLVAFDPSGTTV